MAEFIQAGHYEPHVEAMRALYEGKRGVLDRALAEHCREAGTWAAPARCFFLWIHLGREADAWDLLSRAREEGVSCIPGFHFLVEGRSEPSLRLVFSFLNVFQIRQGVERLSRALARLVEGAQRRVPDEGEARTSPDLLPSTGCSRLLTREGGDH